MNKNAARSVSITLFAVWAAAVVMSSGASASAQGFVEDFEAYTAGTNIDGQGAWRDSRVSPMAGAWVCDALAHSGSHSIEIAAGADVMRGCDLVGGKWLVTAMQYIRSDSTGYSFFSLSEICTERVSQNEVSLMRFNLSGRSVVTWGAATGVASIVFDRWTELKYVVDLDENTLEMYYDGVLIHTQVWDENGLGGLCGINLYGTDGSSVYYDDIAVQAYVEALGVASGPRPLDDANDVPCDVALDWTPGAFAAGHDVYLGTEFEAVSAADRVHPMDVLVSQGQASAQFDPAGLLAFGQTYYWRIDEVNGPPDNTIFKGPVWRFTTEPYAYPVERIAVTSNSTWGEGEGPENTINGSGLNADDEHSVQASDMWLGEASGADAVFIEYAFDRVYKMHEMWVWNYNIQFEPVLGFGLRDVSVEYSENGMDWAALGDVELAQAPATPSYVANTTVAFGGVAAGYVRLTVDSGWGTLGRFGLSEVRFLYIPVHAREPQPADDETGVAVAPVPGWRAGREADLHEVYLSVDEAAVADGSALLGVVDEASCAPGVLEFSQTYFWKVNEVNEAEAISVWEGDIWSFTTAEFGIIDDFERYNDEDNLIFETWVDGWTNKTGSQVGYTDAPFVERSMVHGGRQSMPLHYDNRAAPFYSETGRDFGSVDWTASGADTLRLFVRGQAPSFYEHSDGTILMNGFGRQFGGGWDEDKDELRFAYKELTGDGAIAVRVDDVAHTADAALAGVMIREDLDDSGRQATVAVQANGAVIFRYRAMADGGSEGIMERGLAMPHWVRLSRKGDTFTAERSGDGVHWVSIGDDAAGSSVEIRMADNVMIGLVATSFNAGVATSVEFSGLATAGTVTGDWRTAGVGLAQVPGNAMEPVYVAVEDSAGKVAVVAHPDPSVAGRATWQEWCIALSAFGGVDMATVAKLSIGVGDRVDPTAGGTGLIFIDDVSIGRPSSSESGNGPEPPG